MLLTVVLIIAGLCLLNWWLERYYRRKHSPSFEMPTLEELGIDASKLPKPEPREVPEKVAKQLEAFDRARQHVGVRRDLSPEQEEELRKAYKIPKDRWV